MNRKLLLSLSLILLIGTTYAQQSTDSSAASVATKAASIADSVTKASPDPAPKRWVFSGVTGINASQTSLTNWSAGGENTVAGNAYLNIAAKYKNKSWHWDNILNTEFGLTYTASNKWQKSVDKFELTSLVGYQLSKHWYTSARANFLTQYTKGYKDAGRPKEDYISNLLSPAYLNLALGAEYKPWSVLSIFLSPLASKFTFVADDMLSNAGSFGVQPGKHMLAEIGVSIVGSFKMEVYKNIGVDSKLSLFTAYTHDFGNIDVAWDLMITMRVNKHITANITTNLVYDDDVKTKDALGNTRGAKVQFKELIGVGIAYNF